MSAVAEKLASKLQEWEPEVSREVEARVAEIIELADLKSLDRSHSLRVEQEALRLLDEPLASANRPRADTLPALLDKIASTLRDAPALSDETLSRAVPPRPW